MKALIYIQIIVTTNLTCKFPNKDNQSHSTAKILQAVILDTLQLKYND